MSNLSIINNYQKLENELLELRLKLFYNDSLYYRIYLKATDEEIGYVDLRLGHNATLYYYGNIGYRIHESFRGHGYAFHASQLVLKVAKALNLGYCIITCSPDNIASMKTIEKLKATYLKTVKVPIWHPLYQKERLKMIYRIDLKGE